MLLLREGLLTLSSFSSFSSSFSKTLFFFLFFSTVLLGGPVGETMKQFLREGIQFPETAENWEDEIHLILEFGKGEVWGENASPRANRMIVTHDVNNIETTG